MGRECLIGAPGPTQTQATTSRESRAAGSVLFQSQTIIIDLSVTRNLSMYINVVQNAQSSKSFAKRYFSNKLVKKTYLCQNRRMSGLYKKNLRRYFSGTLSI